jgi:hypothetical protein
MESPDLNHSPSDDAALDAWLRDNAALAPLPDHGFSQRVLLNLPAPTDRAAAKRRLIFCALGALAGVMVPLLTDVGRPEPAAGQVALSRAAQQALQPLADPNVILAATITGVCLLYVFGLPRRLRQY